MRRLVLIRHAKSAWEDPLLTDHQRPLALRGQEAAPKIGRWLADQGAVPDQILCSDAQRTRETWGLIAPLLDTPEPAYLPALYHAGPDVILRELRRATGQTVALVGHNPGMCEFAGLIVKYRPAHPQFDRYPTAATLIAEFSIDDWREATYATARPIAFTVPRDL